VSGGGRGRWCNIEILTEFTAADNLDEVLVR
jgi:hypothetical protein